MKYRPSHPAAIIDLLTAECGLSADSIVADVGSGTSLLSKLFLKAGNRVFGIEPNREMHETGEQLLKGYERFVSIDATAEATTLPVLRLNGRKLRAVPMVVYSRGATKRPTGSV